jgi:ABC-type antimicrobial peptide transport system permease subunit
MLRFFDLQVNLSTDQGRIKEIEVTGRKRSLTTERMLATLSSSFGMLALLLSLVGLYGVISFVVNLRTREIGIRLALGATRLSTIWLVLRRDAMFMIAAGTAIALPCVWALGHLVESQLYDVKPTDPLTVRAGCRLMTRPGAWWCVWCSYELSFLLPV